MLALSTIAEAKNIMTSVIEHQQTQIPAGTWEADIAGERHAAEVSLRPMYDPTSARVRA